jgi:hypothetical protein
VASSIDRVVVSFFISVVTLAACSSGPPKAEALETIRKTVKEDDTCVIPVEITKALKMQYVSKAVCVPNTNAQAAARCMSALLAAGVTAPMPTGYMVEWAEEGTSDSTTMYEHHARNIVFSTCVEMRGLRDGRFPCADVQVDKIVRTKKVDDAHADVVYSRIVTVKSSLAGIEAACGPTTRPPEDAVASFEKGPSGWTIAAPAASGGT